MWGWLGLVEGEAGLRVVICDANRIKRGTVHARCIINHQSSIADYPRLQHLLVLAVSWRFFLCPGVGGSFGAPHGMSFELAVWWFYRPSIYTVRQYERYPNLAWSRFLCWLSCPLLKLVSEWTRLFSLLRNTTPTLPLGILYLVPGIIGGKRCTYHT